MLKTAHPLERGVIPLAQRRKIAACLRQGLSIRKVAAELNVPFSWVRRVHSLQNDAETACQRRQTPAEPSHKSIARQETDGLISRDRLIAVNELVLKDLEREYGTPGNSSSLAQIRERPEEFLPFRRPVLANVTALVFGDPPPGRSALAMRAR
jgi:transposase